MTNKILTYCFYILFFLTPLFFTQYTSELFEFNKMMLTYLLASIILGAWAIKAIQSKTLLLKKTPLDIPLMLFLLSQIVSTIFSIDPHTSIWGYYSRLNGGLLSIITYIFLYYALVSNFDREDAVKFLKAAIFGGVAVSLWAIPESFGFSPSCLILTGDLNASCWVQNVQARVFATLGQPNWLGAYLAMLIFPNLYFLFTSKTRKMLIAYSLSLIALYMAFTFTYSRGASLGLIGGMVAFIGLFVISKPKFNFKKIELKDLKLSKIFLISLGVLLAINVIFGSALTGNFRLFNQNHAEARPVIGSTTVISGTQLENGGTESGAIRLIVWKGALSIWKAYPLFGSGVETFAYSYYNFRPVEHNLVSEWDFLYNKAHNEYLNYLATTGIFGLGTYLALIFWFFYWSIKKVILTKEEPTNKLLVSSILAAYVSYLIQNFVGFSVVIIALFFYLFPALAIVFTAKAEPIKLKLSFLKWAYYPKILTVIMIIITAALVYKINLIYKADTIYKLGSDASDAGNPGRAYNYLADAVSLRDDEPLYKSELGYAAAASAVALEEDATTSAYLKTKAVNETNEALAISPKNTSLWRTAIRTFYQLSLIDPSFEDKTIATIDQTIKLAPTDPKLYYNKGLILDSLKKTPEASASLEQALKLKPNYHEALYTLGLVYEEAGQKDKAIQQMETILKLIPNDPDAIQKLKELKGTK